ncbi:MAG TPA: hypothetical protein ENH94_07745 [Phycisphaerales bacterium]|nr:hypothetical protein [Phycisphaerales bacterium]
MQSDAGLYYYILPTGQIFQYFGGQVGQVDTSYYADPQSFIDAGPAEIPGLAQFVSMDGNVLTISPDISFVGSFNVQVTATDSVTAPVVDTFSVTVNNLGPVWSLLPNDLQVSHNDPYVVPLSAIDPAGDDITYSFAVNTPGAEAYALRTELDLAIYLPLYDNHGGLGQKWMQSDAGLYYYILPSGQVFQYGGGLVGQVDPSYNANPQSLIDQVPLASPDVTFTYIYSTSQLTVNIPVDFVGTFEVIATVSDGAAAVSSSFKVTVVNIPPTWVDLPGDQEMSHNDDTLTVPLSATDSDGDDITYSFAVNTAGAEAHALRTELDLTIYLPQYDNHGGLGQKWMQSDAGLYYYILPSGQVFQYGGGLVGQVDPSYNANPQLLIDQQPVATPAVQFTTASGQLTIDPPVDFEGTFQVNVSASDGAAEISGSFLVTVNNTAPVIGPIDDQTVPHNDLPLSVTLGPTTDADGDDVTYTASLNTTAAHAYEVKTELGLATYLPQYDNIWGQGEKWMQSNTGLYYYILPSGQVFQYHDGQVGQVDPSYNADPQSLIDQQPVATPAVSFSLSQDSGNVACDITPPADFVGTFLVDVTATDEAAMVTDTFSVTVTNAAPVWQQVPDDQTVTVGQTSLVLPVSATNIDGDAITYTASVSTTGATAYELTQRLGLAWYLPQYDNHVGTGRKWMQSDTGLYYYILPTGEVFQYLVGLVGQVDSLYHDDPWKLINQQEVIVPVGVTCAIAAGQLTINLPSGLTGTFEVELTATDGLDTITKTFLVTRQ